MGIFNKQDNPDLNTPWKVQASILNNRKPSLEQAKTWNSFFAVRWLSFNRFSTPIAGVLNRYYNIPPEVQYIFASDYVELTKMKNKVSFISTPKDKRHPDYQKVLDNIQRRYKVNEVQSIEYFNLMDDKERTRMYELYDTGRQK